MSEIPLLSIDDFSYNLPEEKIAQFPLEQRDASKLLISKDDIVTEDIFRNLPNHLSSGNLLIFNDTKVIRARLLFQKETGATVEIFCLEPVFPSREIQTAFSVKGECTWKCLIGNAKRWKDGQLMKNSPSTARLFAERQGTEDDVFLIHFRWEPMELTFSEVLDLSGKIPLPPYIYREAEERDNTRYQTVYAQNDGSVAAPTAGLHFTEEVLQSLKQKNILYDKVTLHVGAGTFKPVTTNIVQQHHMHTEQIIVTMKTLQNLLQNTEIIIAVGTTSLRTLESLYWFGVRLLENPGKTVTFDIHQWEPYEKEVNYTYKEAIEAIIHYLGGKESLSGQTQLMIVPGYHIRSAKAIVTNFHQPKSTLLLLLAAFTGNKWHKAYEYALLHNFRFLSYGDSCLFYR